MTTAPMTLPNAARLRFAATLGLLALGLATLPAGWTRARAAIDSAAIARAEPRRARGQRRRLLRGADRRRRRARGGPQRAGAAAHGEADRLGAVPRGRRLAPPRPATSSSSSCGRTWTGSSSASPSRPMPRACAAGPTPVEKPEGIYRIALLGSSMDMGWGVAAEETYASRLERLAQRPRRPARPGAAVRGDQLRRRGLRPLAAARVVPPQGRRLTIPTW